MRCHEPGCEHESHPELYCAIGCGYCPHHWLELLPPGKNQWCGRTQDEIAMKASAEKTT